ncbi:cytochrome c maturation protein CcmE [Camelimonas abortus]|uniref:Cytochrome c-type biogenesis protein CcmE n=1 Tax=Camelimonas abortus TaxID=1017184 RepID=A0ABV7LG91_9HYPH
MTRKKRRLLLIASALATLAVALGLVLVGLRDTIVFFYGPSEVMARNLPPGSRLRVGGLVKEGSVERLPGQTVRFAITDASADVPVTFSGLLPDLFREGQGVVAEGVLQADRTFLADKVLAKHDERYMPREVAETLKQQGVWKGDGR